MASKNYWRIEDKLVHGIIEGAERSQFLGDFSPTNKFVRLQFIQMQGHKWLRWDHGMIFHDPRFCWVDLFDWLINWSVLAELKIAMQCARTYHAALIRNTKGVNSADKIEEWRMNLQLLFIKRLLLRQTSSIDRGTQFQQSHRNCTHRSCYPLRISMFFSCLPLLKYRYQKCEISISSWSSWSPNYRRCPFNASRLSWSSNLQLGE